MRPAMKIFFPMAICILTALPHLAFAAKCNPETEGDCTSRLKSRYEKVNRYVESRGEKGYSAQQIKNKTEKACSTDHSKRCRPDKDD